MPVEVRRITSREEWLRWRDADLTASDVAAVAGFSTRRSPLAVYVEKTGGVAPEPDNNLLWRGRVLEPAVVAAIRERYPDWQVRRAGVYLRDPEVRLGATPDAVATIPGVAGVVNVQLKVVARSIFNEEWAEPGEGDPPVDYQVQTLSEGMLMEAAHNLVAALVVGEFSLDLKVYDVPRNPSAEERAVGVAREFWKRVREGRPPAATSRDGELLSRMYPTAIPGKTVDLAALDPTIAELLALHETIEEQRKKLQARESELEAKVKSMLADAERGLVPGWRVSFKSSPRKGYEVAPTVVRRLLIKREEE